MSEPTLENVLLYVQKEHDATKAASEYQAVVTRTCVHLYATGIFAALAVFLFSVNIVAFTVSLFAGIVALIGFVIAYIAIGKYDADAVKARTVANGAREYALHPENYLHR